MASFSVENGRPVLLAMVRAIQENKAYLSEVDGLIGDGDHGVNMNKGFTLYAERLGDDEVSLAEGLDALGTLLFSEIGGSMGPIYGTVFMSMAEAVDEAVGDAREMDAALLATMLEKGLDDLCDLVDARVGDKTLVDALAPAAVAARAAATAQKPLPAALADMMAAAEKGRDSTKDMVAKHGRSARLGERSRGVLDAGATSCCLILGAMADGILQIVAG